MEPPFDITNKKQVNSFEEIDPYNPQNVVKGYINKRQGNLYGSLYITHVNNKLIEQFIWATPKMHYPFDKKDNWQFPESDIVEVYVKTDGTNIFGYTYYDSNKTPFLTYKTRLRPFLGSGKFGDFKALWDEMLEKYPDISRLCSTLNYGFSFELFGKRNKILIDYDVPLDCVLLFVREQIRGFLVSPNLIRNTIKTYDVPFLKPVTSLKIINEKVYLNYKDKLEKALEIDEETQTIKGDEGAMWYFIHNDPYYSHPIIQQIKCKPESILKYHWSGDAISYQSIYTTVINAFENWDEPTFQNICELLAEEFDESKIQKSKVRISKALTKVTFDKKYQSLIAKDYKAQNFNINKDKVTCMRWFAKNYPKSMATKIYQLLKQYEDKCE